MRKLTATTSMVALVLAAANSGAMAQTLDTTQTGSIGNDAMKAEILSLPEWYDDLELLNAVRADEMIGMEVFDTDGEEIGTVENLIFSDDGEVLSLVAEVGGFWDIGDTHVNVPWDRVQLTETGVVTPVTEETVGEYSLFEAEYLSAADAAQDITEVDDDLFGDGVTTGPRAFRATEYIGDYVRLVAENDMVNYGYVEDLLINNGRIEAVMVRPDVGWGTQGLYAYPYYDSRLGATPGSPYYDLPYSQAEIERIEPVADAS